MEAESKWCKKQNQKNIVKRESKARVSTNQNKRRWENDTRKAERNHTHVTNVLIVDWKAVLLPSSMPPGLSSVG